jgi:DNA polymerase-3 subunit gamma/tau
MLFGLDDTPDDRDDQAPGAPSAGGLSLPGMPPAATPANAAPAVAPTQTQSLYRRYRPQSFDADDLVGQEHIVRTLRNAVERGRVAHAYLFCGPRGTGKTTTARLLAKAANCLDPDPHVRPCNRCAHCVAITTGATTDVIEIDAASNRGIDDIRDLRERVKYAPTHLKTKFYIIDEAHQITGAAGNAFLKTLEEPPPHTKFVLATTDPEDLLPTIVSRCQRFDFRRISLSAAVNRLRTVATAEGLEVDDEALAAIARAGTGSLRDSLGLLDQLSVYQESGEQAGSGVITADSVRALLGVSRNDRVETIARALADRDVASGLDAINGAVEAGEDPRQLNRQLVAYLRILMHELAGGSPDADATARELAQAFDLHDLAKIAQRFSENDSRIRHAAIPQLPFEIALVESILRPAGGTVTSAAPATPRTTTASRPAPSLEPAQQAPPRQAPPAPPRDEPPAPPVAAATPVRPAQPSPAEPESYVPDEPDWMREADPDLGTIVRRPAAESEPPPAPRTGPSIRDRVRNPSARVGAPPPQREPAPSAAPQPRQEPPRSPATPARPAANPDPAQDGGGEAVSVQRLVELWSRIRADVKLQNRRIEALLAEVDPVAIEGGTVVLRAAYPFHRKRLEEDDVKEVVQAAVSRRAGTSLKVRTILKGEDDGSIRLVPSPNPPPPVPRSNTRPEFPGDDIPEVAADPELHRAEEPTPDPVPAVPSYNAESADAPEPGSGGAAARPAAEARAFRPEDDEAIVQAARTIFDGEEIPDPFAGEDGTV